MPNKILIVEDSPTIVTLLSFRLKENGFLVESAENGKIGLEKMRNINPDLVLLDVRMPEMDGLELCRIAKSDSELKKIPIVFLTTMTESWARDKAKELGAEGYFVKPFVGIDLVQEINKLLGRDR